MRFYHEFSATCPDEVSTAGLLLSAPDGTPAVGIAACYTGPIEEGEPHTISVAEEGGFEPSVPLGKESGLPRGSGRAGEVDGAVSEAVSLLSGTEGSNPLRSASESVVACWMTTEDRG